MNVIAFVLAALAALLAVSNALSLFVSLRNQRRGVPRHVSMVYLVPQILVLLAYGLTRRVEQPWITDRVLLGIALFDISFWCLLAMPIALRRRP
jgi:hypothetical protein